MAESEAKPKPPKHLRAQTRTWWAMVVASYQLESHHLRLLEMAATAWDEYEIATERLAADGHFVVDRFGITKAHPAIAVARDARISFSRLLRELNLDSEDTPPSRPPVIPGRYK